MDAALEKCASLKPWVNGVAISPASQEELIDWIAQSMQSMEHLDVDVVIK